MRPRRLLALGCALLLALPQASLSALGHAGTAASDALSQEICSVSETRDFAPGDEEGAPGRQVHGKHCQLCAVAGAVPSATPVRLRYADAGPRPARRPGSFHAQASTLTPPGTGPPSTR